VYRNNNIVSLGFVNKTSIPYKVALAFNESKNILFSIKNPRMEKVKYNFYILYIDHKSRTT
jgi:hypothetical protein